MGIKEFDSTPLGDLYISKSIVTNLSKKGNGIKNITFTTPLGIKDKNIKCYYKVEASAIVPLDPINTSAGDLYDILIRKGTSQKKAKEIVGELL